MEVEAAPAPTPEPVTEPTLQELEPEPVVSEPPQASLEATTSVVAAAPSNETVSSIATVTVTASLTNSTLPSDVDKLRQLKLAIIRGQHPIFRPNPQPEALEKLFLGPHPESKNVAPYVSGSLARKPSVDTQGARSGNPPSPTKRSSSVDRHDHDRRDRRSSSPSRSSYLRPERRDSVSKPLSGSYVQGSGSGQRLPPPRQDTRDLPPRRDDGPNHRPPYSEYGRPPPPPDYRPPGPYDRDRSPPRRPPSPRRPYEADRYDREYDRFERERYEREMDRMRGIEPPPRRDSPLSFLPRQSMAPPHLPADSRDPGYSRPPPPPDARRDVGPPHSTARVEPPRPYAPLNSAPQHRPPMHQSSGPDPRSASLGHPHSEQEHYPDPSQNSHHHPPSNSQPGPGPAPPRDAMQVDDRRPQGVEHRGQPPPSQVPREYPPPPLTADPRRASLPTLGPRPDDRPANTDMRGPPRPDERAPPHPAQSYPPPVSMPRSAGAMQPPVPGQSLSQQPPRPPTQMPPSGTAGHPGDLSTAANGSRPPVSHNEYNYDPRRVSQPPAGANGHQRVPSHGHSGPLANGLPLGGPSINNRPPPPPLTAGPPSAQAYRDNLPQRPDAVPPHGRDPVPLRQPQPVLRPASVLRDIHPNPAPSTAAASQPPPGTGPPSSNSSAPPGPPTSAHPPPSSVGHHPPPPPGRPNDQQPPHWRPGPAYSPPPRDAYDRRGPPPPSGSADSRYYDRGMPPDMERERWDDRRWQAYPDERDRYAPPAPSAAYPPGQPGKDPYYYSGPPPPPPPTWAQGRARSPMGGMDDDRPPKRFRQDGPPGPPGPEYGGYDRDRERDPYTRPPYGASAPPPPQHYYDPRGPPPPPRDTYPSY
ncbi:hypothetical protein BKA62DRAFT_824195 [Auriculariales sp. MPI-PUGE-AT-0066]|nr:hypothetical protein BKA62DRAFT_824195 [Auriculariales sp. MPI-PUGE-AT-0066]